ncbi:MAG: ATP-grasp domain-containing protein [Planctomycetota bacterium]|nr:MAG: ATP-grasp domain-containing protein [Planctomycetota bacterium]
MSGRTETVLVANRGEIAVRVIRACRETGRRAVAVYSEADADALHVQLADRSVCIGPPPAAQSYLDVEKIIAAARRTGATAVHPGYGFLAENAAAAQAIEDAGLVWIGPSPASIAAVGDKLEARRIAQEAGVPLASGSEGAVAPDDVAEVASRVGVPLLLKAVGGGGGKGIRLVEDLAELGPALERAMGEAQSAFGAPAVYLEKCIRPARHIEVQILGDGQGRAVHLGERECSLQRRAQKVVEESPSPFATPALRERMGAAAVALAEAVSYRGAGTVEFLVDEDGAFYFLEVNARLQVEHPVTELCTGIDLVRAQLEVAETGRLGLTQADWSPRGHAIQLRVNAEDPFRGFVPAVGEVRGLRLPGGPFVRVDTFLTEGAQVSPHYDSLVAKLCAWGRTRAEAVERWAAAANEASLGALPSTLPLAGLLARDSDFRAGAFHTQWLEPWVAALPAPELDAETGGLAALAAAVAAWEAGRSPRSAADAPGGNGLRPWVLAHRARLLREGR